jgi:hypothetical protein
MLSASTRSPIVEDADKVIYPSAMTHGQNKKNFEIFTAAEFIATITRHHTPTSGIVEAAGGCSRGKNQSACTWPHRPRDFDDGWAQSEEPAITCR